MSGCFKRPRESQINSFFSPKATRHFLDPVIIRFLIWGSYIRRHLRRNLQKRRAKLRHAATFNSEALWFNSSWDADGCWSWLDFVERRWLERVGKADWTLQFCFWTPNQIHMYCNLSLLIQNHWPIRYCDSDLLHRISGQWNWLKMAINSDQE